MSNPSTSPRPIPGLVIPASARNGDTEDAGGPEETPVRVALRPMGDKVLVRLDHRAPSALDAEHRPYPLPSGVVVDVGLGVFCSGVGYLGSKVKPGDHVAFETAHGVRRMPIVQSKEWKLKDPVEDYEVYALIPEVAIVGILTFEGGDPQRSVWFAKAEPESLIHKPR